MRQGLRFAIGGGLGLFLCWLLFRNTDWSAVGEAIGDMHIGWFIASQLYAWASHIVRVQRWSYVVRAVHPASFRSLFSSTAIGFLVNSALVARVGEFVRAHVLARLERTSTSSCLSMVALDRASDLIGLLAVFLVALVSFPLDRSVEVAAGVLGNTEPLVLQSDLVRVAVIGTGAVVAVLCAILVFLYVRQQLVLRMMDATIGRVSKRFSGALGRIFQNFAEGMHVFRNPGDLLKSLFWTLALWLLNMLSLAALMSAFDMEYPWYAPWVLLALIAVGISIPVAPGMIGQYHAGVIAGLLLAVPSIPAPDAQAFAIVTHVASLIPVAALGFYALSLEKLSFLDLVRRQDRSG